MNKTELIAAAASQTGVSKKDAERVFAALIDNIGGALARGERVQLSGFGIFEVKERKGRIGRNPHTNSEIEIPACKVPAFKPSKTLRDMVDG